MRSWILRFKTTFQFRPGWIKSTLYFSRQIRIHP